MTESYLFLNERSEVEQEMVNRDRDRDRDTRSETELRVFLCVSVSFLKTHSPTKGPFIFSKNN